MFISKNKNFKEEYCATVVQIGETFPIEGKDRIVKTLVNGLSIVIGKDEFKTGDIAVYCANETCLHELFLHLNSMYEDKELNIDQEKKGYINKHGQSLPNYHYEDLLHLRELYSKSDLVNPAVVIDTNHANSGKQYLEQIRIAKEVMYSRRYNKDICKIVKGFMIESYI